MVHLIPRLVDKDTDRLHLLGEYIPEVPAGPRKAFHASFERLCKRFVKFLRIGRQGVCKRGCDSLLELREGVFRDLLEFGVDLFGMFCPGKLLHLVQKLLPHCQDPLNVRPAMDFKVPEGIHREGIQRGGNLIEGYGTAGWRFIFTERIFYPA